MYAFVWGAQLGGVRVRCCIRGGSTRGQQAGPAGMPYVTVPVCGLPNAPPLVLPLP